jgi:hypothetical protein
MDMPLGFGSIKPEHHRPISLVGGEAVDTGVLKAEAGDGVLADPLMVLAVLMTLL